jgi:hypothetical protein
MEYTIDWAGLLCDSSKLTVVRGAEAIETDAALFAEAIDLALADKKKLSQRAARSAVLAAIRYPFLARPHSGRLIRAIGELKNESIIFAFLKMFSEIELPEDEDETGHLMKLCFDFMEKPVERIAIRIYAIEILYRITCRYPELKNELGLMIKHLMPHSPPAFQSRGSRILKKLKNETGFNFSETF